MKQGILLINLGSPDSYQKEDVRRYLGEFLMDERVIDFSKALRTFLIKGIILNTRPKKSAAAYESIWWPEGSPLIVLSERLQKAVQEHTELPVELAMRYGNPSIYQGLQRLKQNNADLEEIVVIPLYPHYAMSSYETVAVKAQEVARKHFPELKVHIQEAFYQDERYLEILGNSLKPFLEKEYDHVLFSYHGVPERHIKKSDVTRTHCLCHSDCCKRDSPAHLTCYRHQTTKTTEMVARYLHLPKGHYSSSFQSRLGPIQWLTPYTDKTIAEFPAQGVKKLLVLCPAFVSDCLETIEEIGVEAREIFRENGGEEFTLVPCLNDGQDWAQYLVTLAQEKLKNRVLGPVNT